MFQLESFEGMAMLTQRENALRVIKRTEEYPEWIPVAEDCMWIMIPSVVYERPKGEGGPDWFGCEWAWDEPTRGHTPLPGAEFVVQDITKWREQVTFPDIDAIDWEAAAEKDLKDFDRENKLLTVFWESGPFERSHHLLGFEEAFVAMYEEPEAYKELTEAITDWRIEAMKRCFAAYKPDLVFTHDDLGHAHAPFISIDFYREFIKPCHKRLFEAIHETGTLVLSHSCGCMEQYIGDLLEIGADILHPLQGGTVNNQMEVFEKYAGKAVFQSAFDPLIHEAKSTEEELRAEVRRVVDLFAPSRSLILDCASLGPGATEILYDEAVKYGADYWKRNGLI